MKSRILTILFAVASLGVAPVTPLGDLGGDAHLFSADCAAETGAAEDTVCIDNDGAGGGIWYCPAPGDCSGTTAWVRKDGGGSGFFTQTSGVLHPATSTDDLGNEKTFMFGMDEAYKEQLKHKNANLENYFDPYVREDGSWDYDLLSSHRTVIDNIDKIVQSAYRQGMSDGQRGVVQTAANVQSKAPNDVTGQQNSNPLGEQVKQILQRNRSTMTFNI